MITLNQDIRIDPKIGNTYICICNDINSEWLCELTYLGDNEWRSINDQDNDKGVYVCIVEHAIYLVCTDVVDTRAQELYSLHMGGLMPSETYMWTQCSKEYRHAWRLIAQAEFEG